MVAAAAAAAAAAVGATAAMSDGKKTVLEEVDSTGRSVSRYDAQTMTFPFFRSDRMAKDIIKARETGNWREGKRATR